MRVNLPRYSLELPAATTRASAFFTAERSNGSPSSVRYAPCARFTLDGEGSSKNAATSPKIGSGGHSSTAAQMLPWRR